VYVGDLARGEYVGDLARGALDGVCAPSCGGTVFVLTRGLSDGDLVREFVDDFARGSDGDFARGEFVGDFARGEFVGDFARGEFVGDFARGEFVGDSARAPVGDLARSELVGDFARAPVGDLARAEVVGEFARELPASARVASARFASARDASARVASARVASARVASARVASARVASAPGEPASARRSRTVSSLPRPATSTKARRGPIRTSIGSSVPVSAVIIAPIAVPRVTDVSCSIVSGRAVRFVMPLLVRIAIGRPTPSTTSVTPSRSRYPRSWSSWPTVL
jgi:hypothetical protein